MRRGFKSYRHHTVGITFSTITLLYGASLAPAHAEDKNQRDALLEAALQRISALEAKVGRINSLEDENRQLRSKLVKVENKQDAALKVSSKSLARSQPAPMTNDHSYVAATNSNISNSKATLWEGAYAGINAGYGTSDLRTYTNTTTYSKTYNSVEELVNENATSYLGGAVAGGQFGYNHIFANQLMLGAEADIDWADIYNRAAPNSTGNINIERQHNPFNGEVEINASSASAYGRQGLNWIGTLRGRVGYDLGKFLPYITAGLAYGETSNNNHEINQALSYYVSPQPPRVLQAYPTGSYAMGNSGSISAGWAAGAGAEYMVADGWSVKGEYLYTSIGGVTTPQISKSIEQNDTTNFVTTNTGSFGVHQARVGLNYHPGWSFTEPVLAAK